MENTSPLHLCRVQKSSLINRSHMLLHSLALMSLIYYRSSFFFQHTESGQTPFTPWLLVFAAELMLSCFWFLSQAFLWRPFSRSVFPDKLPKDKELPAIDVFICTADPNKEPTVDVMNTVISAMALDYPPDKLYVYLSDDGGSSMTLRAMQEAWRFAKWWLPFCRRHGIKTLCPEAYFFEVGEKQENSHNDFLAEEEKVKEKYDNFKERLTRIRENTRLMINRDHPPIVEVINETSINEEGAERAEMPLLVYVSREKRPSHPHNFKAGALNALLRVSAIMSNSAYILVLDCDMYCNDPTSARQAMCFHLDPEISPSLAFVQFPQKYHNIGKADIYDSQLRLYFKVQWQGMDGIQGPILSGTGFYIKREALLNPKKEDVDIMELKHSFGPSNEFTKSLGRYYKPNLGEVVSAIMLEEIQFLASCAYENETKWGREVGFLYFTIAEDYFTGFVNLHGNGWKSVYCDPVRPSFLGSATTNLNDVLVQNARWSSSLVEVVISRFCPLFYTPEKISALETMCYAEHAIHPLFFLPMWCLATIPQLCLLNGIRLYPEVSDWFFCVFSFIFLSSHLKHIQEVLSTGDPIWAWRNEQMMWMIKNVTCHTYGSFDAIMKKIGFKEASFPPTNKVVDEEQLKLYKMGKIDFQTSIVFLAPMVSLVLLNLASFVGGLTRAVVAGNFSEMFVQIVLSFFIVVMNYPIVEGMILRKDKGRIPSSVTSLSALISMIFLSLGSFFFMYL
ncbi:cellulose synthase A catalytic subunit 4 [UDP-forming]-like isoform X4 [Diospyros lotus]|uniref:cellulose synthase A catalytic subunit 4 [UDP-forming]-like isoform X4 n=1 Tax=Diospyros lotus TaxID=55363 RepID=UPI00225323D8|nr:cellulose synthase A catalytic subunit 4 [UDP-forming]-like isoform X4 [Diospyros lotus]